VLATGKTDDANSARLQLPRPPSRLS